jgi:hypothetical protein
MFRKSLFTTGLCAVSLSVAMLAGCSSPVTAPTTPGDVSSGAPAVSAPAPEIASPALPAPAAVTPATLAGKASYRGEALSGYAVSVFDAQTGKPVARKADLAGVDTLAVLDQNLVTDAQGAFSLQVVGLKAGQALRVVVSKGNSSLETVVTSDLKAVGSAKLHVLAEGGDLTINELTTAIAKVARGVLSTTQVLTPEAAAPVLAKLAAEMAALSGKLEAALAKNPSLAPGLIAGENKSADAAVKSLVEGAGALKDLSQKIAALVGDVAKAAKEARNQSPAANDAAVKAALVKVEFVGTVLTGAFASNGFTMTNTVTGQTVDATSSEAGTVSGTTTASSGGGSSNRSSLTSAQSAALAAINGVTYSETNVEDEKALLTLLETHKATLGLATETWNKLLKLSAYTPAGGNALVLTSGRQQAVATYLLERMHDRTATGTFTYTTLAALKADFAYAVTKETTKWELIVGIANAASDADAADVLSANLPALQADFENYLSWHADWTVPDELWAGGWAGQSRYFANNAINLGAYAALGATAKEQVAAAVRAKANGVSDMKILDGLHLGLMGDINAETLAGISTANQQAVMELLEAHRTTLAIDDAVWSQFLKLSTYDRSGNEALVPTSGRQQAVAKYLLERIHDRTAAGTFKYGNVDALRDDFEYAVNKEANKWNLIIDIADAKAMDAGPATSAALSALNRWLPMIKDDFEDYLTWHADWSVEAGTQDWKAGWGGTETYFAENITNLDAFLDADAVDQTPLADAVIRRSNGYSDMAILAGLRPPVID